MSRLTHTFLMTAICLVCASSAFARQYQMDSVFPPTLGQALDQTAPATRIVAPRQTTMYSQERHRSKTSEMANQPSRQTTGSEARSAVGETTPRLDKSTVHSSSPKFASSTIRKSSIPSPASATPTPENPLTPFPRAQPPFARPTKPEAMSRSVVERNRTGNATQDFGTVMTFPAEIRLSDDSPDGQPPRDPIQDIGQNTGDLGADSQTALTPIRKQHQSILNIPPIVSGNGSNSDWNFERPEVASITQVSDRPNPVIRTTVFGPDVLIQDTPDLFEIEVANNSSQVATNIIVQMGVSENLTITNFDRQAWLDNRNRTVSWKLDSLPSGYKDVIRFRAVSSTPGSHEQSITVGMENTFQGQTEFVAHVVNHPDGVKLELPALEE